MAIDRSNHILFSACDNQMLAVVNSQSGKVLQTVPIGDDCDAVAFDRNRTCVRFQWRRNADRYP